MTLVLVVQLPELYLSIDWGFPKPQNVHSSYRLCRYEGLKVADRTVDDPSVSVAVAVDDMLASSSIDKAVTLSHPRCTELADLVGTVQRPN